MIEPMMIRKHAFYSFVFIASLFASLFYNGQYIEYYSVSLSILMLGLLFLAHDNYDDLSIPRNSILLTLLLFFLWMTIHIFIGSVTYLSIINLWWVGGFVVTFIMYQLVKQKDKYWLYSYSWLIALLLGLCVYALYQRFGMGGDPRATFINKNSFAALLNLCMFPLLACYMGENKGFFFKQKPLILLILFVFFFLIAIIGSRGALLAFAIALLVYIISTKHTYGWRPYLIIGGLFIAALLLGYMISFNDSISRTFITEYSQESNSQRLLIWQGSWKLFEESPWYGWGLGAYWLFWPSYKLPEDRSAGFYAHNDYLQFAIELSVIGLALFLVFLFSIFYLYLKRVYSAKKQGQPCTEFAAVYAGLLTVMLHSFFTFNFYILPTTLAFGLLLGRFQQLIAQQTETPVWRFQPSQYLRKSVYYLSVIGLVAIPLIFFVTLAASMEVSSQAKALERENKMLQAHERYNLARSLAPLMDIHYFVHADFLRRSIESVPETRPDEKQKLANLALELLSKAKKLNPLRPQTYYILGLLYRDSTIGNKEENTKLALDAFQKTLLANPRHIPARLDIAKILYEHDKKKAALSVLIEGTKYPFRPSRTSIYYINKMADLFTEIGDKKQADHFRAIAEDFRHKLTGGNASAAATQDSKK